MFKYVYCYCICGFIDDNVKLYGIYFLGNKIFLLKDILKFV